jgi:hypothetical protein
MGLGSQVPSAVWRIDPNLVFPRIYQANATIERQLPAGFVLVSDRQGFRTLRWEASELARRIRDEFVG